ncbi:YihY/virulence factor BrkB family protein [Eubacteriales bacterium OttesenSCG-928-G02]|nr:YihY/virulence factor BrkB family protein [Eubacteriales bacterium OttesenSCG-928-G02]
MTYFSDKYSEQSLNAYSAQAAFFIFIAAFPFAILLLTIIGMLPIELFDFENTANLGIIKMFGEVFKEAIAQTKETSSVMVFIITIITTLWASSKGMLALIRGLNASNDVKENRNYLFLRLNAVLYTFIFLIIIIATLALLVFGNLIQAWLESIFPEIKAHIAVVSSFKFIILLVLLTLLFATLYKFLPNKKIKFSQVIPGASITSIGWLVFSYVYSLYVDKAAMNTTYYGNLTGIIFLLLWLYFCMSIFMFGALLNATLFIEKSSDNKN